MTKSIIRFDRNELDFVYDMRLKDFKDSNHKLDDGVLYEALQIIEKQHGKIFEECKKMADSAKEDGDPVKYEIVYKRWVLFLCDPTFPVENSTKFESADQRLYDVINPAGNNFPFQYKLTSTITKKCSSFSLSHCSLKEIELIKKQICTKIQLHELQMKVD